MLIQHLLPLKPHRWYFTIHNSTYIYVKGYVDACKSIWVNSYWVRAVKLHIKDLQPNTNKPWTDHGPHKQFSILHTFQQGEKISLNCVCSNKLCDRYFCFVLSLVLYSVLLVTDVDATFTIHFVVLFGSLGWPHPLQ